MPNFNKGKYIKEAIESVLAQKYHNWELVIVDDSSTDNSLDVIKSFLDNKKIKLIKNVINKGVAYVASQAVESSSGEIIGTLDSDDLLHEDALMVMLNEHKANPDFGLIYSNHYICNNNFENCVSADWLPRPDDKCFQELIFGRQDGKTISMHFRTFKRNAYDMTDGYDASLLCFEDRDLYYKFEKVTKIKGMNRCLYYYRDTPEIGAYRNNPKERDFWFLCEYKETKRRLGVTMPLVNNKKMSPFLSNLMYIYLLRYSEIENKKLRRKLHWFLFGMGNANLKNNKLLAFLYYLNSFVYGYTPISLRGIKKIIS
jgi:glycosyltransferase involved in cell wall biosynthesis